MQHFEGLHPGGAETRVCEVFSKSVLNIEVVIEQIQAVGRDRKRCFPGPFQNLLCFLLLHLVQRSSLLSPSACCPLPYLVSSSETPFDPLPFIKASYRSPIFYVRHIRRGTEEKKSIEPPVLYPVRVIDSFIHIHSAPRNYFFCIFLRCCFGNTIHTFEVHCIW
jgi:hypothetical protein